jgi:hypothetical protein
MGGACGMQGRKEICARGFGGDILKSKIAGLVCVVWRIILKCMLKV